MSAHAWRLKACCGCCRVFDATLVASWGGVIPDLTRSVERGMLECEDWRLWPNYRCTGPITDSLPMRPSGYGRESLADCCLSISNLTPSLYEPCQCGVRLILEQSCVFGFVPVASGGLFSRPVPFGRGFGCLQFCSPFVYKGGGRSREPPHTVSSRELAYCGSASVSFDGRAPYSTRSSGERKTGIR